MDKNEKDLLIKQNEQFRKAYDRYGDRLLSIIPDDSLETISGGNGRWFISDSHVCGLCDDCKIWSYDPDAGRSLSEAVLEKIFQMNTTSTHLYSDCCPA